MFNLKYIDKPTFLTKLVFHGSLIKNLCFAIITPIITLTTLWLSKQKTSSTCVFLVLQSSDHLINLVKQGQSNRKSFQISLRNGMERKQTHKKKKTHLLSTTPQKVNTFLLIQGQRFAAFLKICPLTIYVNFPSFCGHIFEGAANLRA